MTYTYGMKGSPATGGGAPGLPRTPEIRGELLLDIPGTYFVTVPDGVTIMCALVRSGAGGAFYNSNGGNFFVSSGGGAGMAYVNNMPVTPLEQLMVVVGVGGASSSQSTITPVPAGSGGESYVRDPSTVRASGGVGGTQGSAVAGGIRTAGDGGANGGSGAFISTTGTIALASGGAAAGYVGNGANGVASTSSGVAAGNPGTIDSAGSGVPGAPSGGVGMFGQGLPGLGGTVGSLPTTLAGVGKGGSGGRDGALRMTRGAGAALDGAGGSANYSSSPDLDNGSDGAVRLIWGPGRSFPSTDVG